MSSIEDRLNAVIRSGGTSTPAPDQAAKKAAPNSISERLDKVIASGKGQPSVYKAPTSTTKASTSKNQWVSTGGGRKSTTGAGKNNKSSAPKKSFFEIATQNKAPGRVAGNAQPRQTSYAGQLGQVSRNAAAPNSRYDAGGLRTAQKKEVAAPSIGKDRSNQYSLRKGLESVVLKGGQQVAQAAGNTAALAEDLVLAPFELFSGQELGSLSDNAPFNTWARGIQREGQELQDKYAGNVAKGGKAAELLDRYGASTVAAVPQAVLAMLTSGGSMAASTAGLSSTAASELAPGVASTIRRSIAAAAKDPQYWLSFGQVVGDGYESALQDMQASGKYDNNTARTKAALYAIGNGILNAEVEVGGGIQKLPDELKHGAAAWKAWVNSMVDEGKEEVVQGVIERAMQNSVYGKGNPLASLSDPNAILNPRTAAEEFAGGAIVGGVLGAGQIGAQKVLESRNNRATPQQPTQQAPGAQADVQEGTYTSTPANAAEGAQTAPEPVDVLSEVLFGRKRADLNTMTEAQQDAIFRANEEGTVGMDAAGKVFQIDPEEHIDRRSMASVGNKAVNAFQFDHPELHNYYQQAAADLIADADLSLQMPQSRRYERTAQGNTVVQQSQTSQALRTAMDETNLSRDAIIDAAQRIITDQGQENMAAAKRVELVLDEMLSNGYTTMDGRTVAPNERYLSAKRDIPGMAERSGETLPIFDTPGDAAAGAVNTDFDRMQARSEEFHPINENSARRVMNEQNAAPSEVPTVNPDTGNNITKTVSTILNSPLTSQEMKPIYESAIAGGKFDYTVQTDRDAVQRAQARIARDGWQEVANTFIGKVDNGKSVNKIEMAEAISAYNTAVSEGNHQAAFELGAAISEAAHTSAQVTQAMNLMNRLTPEGKLLTLRKFVDKLNRKQQAKPNRKPAQTATQVDIDNTRMNYVEDFTGFRISDELASNYLMAETDAERAAAWDAITTDIAGQLPSTFREKADFIRYTSMLTNPTTHIRNILGNAIQAGARTLKNGLGALIERAAIKDQSQRTKSVLVGEDAKALKDFARGQYETDQSAAMGAGKYSDASYRSIDREIMSKKKAFKGENLLSRGIQAVGDFNNAALDFEDVLFNRSAYVDSFAQALKAKGVTAEEAAAGTRSADVEAARAYAIEEARRATYRNTTALSEAVSKMGRYEGDNPVLKAASFAADAFMPFRRTPANILTTGLDYSPVGLLKAVTVDAAKVKNGTMSGADMVDHLSSGLTGTGILALGTYLAAEGLLHVRAGDDDKEEAFEKASGKQDYALQIGGYSYSLDWAVPAAMPLFAGAAIMQSAEKGGSSFDAVVDSMLGMQDVVLETSMLSTLNDFLSNISYAKSKPMYVIDRAITNYAGQYIPTVGSKIASAMDDTVRKSYVEKGTGQVSSDVNYFLQGAAKKVPGARNQLQPSIDLWGREVSNGSAPARVFQSFLSPGYLKKADDSAATQEVRRLAEATGDSSVYPTAMDKSFTVDKKEKTLTAAEYTQYAKSAGSTRKKLIEEAVKLPAYKAMSNKEKVKYVKDVYDYARYVARKEIAPEYTEDEWMEHAKNAKQEIDVSTAEYIALYEKYGSRNMSGSGYDKVKRAVSAGLTVDEYMGAKDGADTDGNGSVTKAEASAWIAQSGKRNKADLWDIICTTNAKNPYK